VLLSRPSVRSPQCFLFPNYCKSPTIHIPWPSPLQYKLDNTGPGLASHRHFFYCTVCQVDVGPTHVTRVHHPVCHTLWSITILFVCHVRNDGLSFDVGPDAGWGRRFSSDRCRWAMSTTCLVDRRPTVQPITAVGHQHDRPPTTPIKSSSPSVMYKKYSPQNPLFILSTVCINFIALYIHFFFPSLSILAILLDMPGGDPMVSDPKQILLSKKRVYLSQTTVSRRTSWAVLWVACFYPLYSLLYINHVPNYIFILLYLPCTTPYYSLYIYFVFAMCPKILYTRYCIAVSRSHWLLYFLILPKFSL